MASPSQNTGLNIPLLPSAPTAWASANAPLAANPAQETPKTASAQPKPSALPLTCGGFPAAGQPEPDFTPYLATVQNKIRSHWHPPAVDQPKHVVVLYRIACNGQLVRADVKTSSGLPVADQAALAAVKSASPFPALPATYVGRSVDVEFDFDYEMKANRKPHAPIKQ
jgi:protein TonB